MFCCNIDVITTLLFVRKRGKRLSERQVVVTVHFRKPIEHDNLWLNHMVHKPFLILFLSSSLIYAHSTYKSSLSPLHLPLAPYNVKLYCRNGRINETNTLRPNLCPSASTSCGFFQFSVVNSTNQPIGAYECVDTSIFLNEEREESGLGADFAYLCSHQPRCHNLSIPRLNRQFLHYLIQTYGFVDIDKKSTTSFRFCCALSHGTLQRLIASGQNSFNSTSSPVVCSEEKCLSGAIGCLSHDRVKQDDATSRDYEYQDVKPVEIIWEDEELKDEYERGDATVLAPEFSISTFEANEPVDHLHCVYPHFNDELYRYCLLIYSQKSKDLCFTSGGHKICCCFVSPDRSTCNPRPNNITLETSTTSTTTTTTELITTTVSTVRKTNSRKHKHHHLRRTKCRTVYIHDTRKGYTPKPRKEIICEKHSIQTQTDGATSQSLTFVFWVLLILIQTS
ncbi:hypothetical protein M3Y98_00553000 [Aphelenchoides besseyi]|nr:hypothetical protein M3Y98_00553000 [Aphelenchoides besseyi]KAI6194119.1 hypothetical protein M3Y96_01091000 [Aphelenchoides besseyi]